MLYEELSNSEPRPFNWKFDREPLADGIPEASSRYQAK